MDIASETYLQALTASAAQILSGNLVGIYLHGSAVLGGYVPSRSDIDILIVVTSPLSEDQQVALSNALSQPSLPCPAVGLELSVVTTSVAGDAHTPPDPAFELHMTTAEKDCKVIYGMDREGDEDLVLHFWVTRARGRALLGPPAREVFAAISEDLVREQVKKEIKWARGSSVNREYTILNAARAWAAVLEGVVLGKVEGGEWALKRVKEERRIDVLRWALARQMNWEEEELEVVEKRDVDEFVDFVMSEMGRCK